MSQWKACCLSSSTVRKYLYRNRQDSRLPSRSFIWRKSWERHGPLSRVNGAHSASLYMSRRRFLWMRSFLRLYDFPQVIVADYVEQDSAELDPQLVLLGCGVRFRCSLFFSCRLPASYNAYTEKPIALEAVPSFSSCIPHSSSIIRAGLILSCSLSLDHEPHLS